MKLKDGIKIEDVADGALIERANEALAAIAWNILDPNTKPDEARTVTIKVKIKPDSQRSVASVEIGVATKLAQPQAAKTNVFISQKSNGEIVLSERDTRQEQLFEEPKVKHLEQERERRAEEKEDAAREAAE